MEETKAAATGVVGGNQLQSVRHKNPVKADMGCTDEISVESLKVKIQVCKGQTTQTFDKFLNRG